MTHVVHLYFSLFHFQCHIAFDRPATGTLVQKLPFWNMHVIVLVHIEKWIHIFRKGFNPVI